MEGLEKLIEGMQKLMDEARTAGMTGPMLTVFKEDEEGKLGGTLLPYPEELMELGGTELLGLAVRMLVKDQGIDLVVFGFHASVKKVGDLIQEDDAMMLFIEDKDSKKIFMKKLGKDGDPDGSWEKMDSTDMKGLMSSFFNEPEPITKEEFEKMAIFNSSKVEDIEMPKVDVKDQII